MTKDEEKGITSARFDFEFRVLCPGMNGGWGIGCGIGASSRSIALNLGKQEN